MNIRLRERGIVLARKSVSVKYAAKSSQPFFRKLKEGEHVLERKIGKKDNEKSAKVIRSPKAFLDNKKE